VPTVAQAAHPVSRPGNNVRYAGCDLLLAARAPVGLGGVHAGDPPDEPLPVAVGLAPFDPTDGPVEVELGALNASAMWSRHGPIVAGRSVGGTIDP